MADLSAADEDVWRARRRLLLLMSATHNGLAVPQERGCDSYGSWR
jgi:hypothetical protein